VKKTTKEASTVAGIRGFSAPYGMVRKDKKQKKNNVSKPFGDSDLFERLIIDALLEGKSVKEVVRKRGDRWILFDDDTDSEIASFTTRTDAWDRQRKRRQSAEFLKKQKKASDTERKKAAEKSKNSIMPKSVAKESLNITEGSSLSYVFENNPSSEESAGWENFVSKLSKQTVLSDSKLKNILEKIGKAEAQILQNALDSLKSSMQKAGFKVIKAESQNNLGDVQIGFYIISSDKSSKLPFFIKLDNGKPVVDIPEETKNILNSSGNEESKLLRAELIHVQETVFDNMQDVLDIAKKRDEYLKKLQDKVDKILQGVSPLELAMIRFLSKMKYKGVK